MNKKYMAAGAGIIISAALSAISLYLTAMGLVITATFLMCLKVSESAEKAMDKPIISVSTGDDGKSLVIRNYGCRDAHNINLVILPEKTEYKEEILPQDSERTITCNQYIAQNRIIADYYDSKGHKYQKTFDINSRGDCEYDPSKPLIPLFR